MWAMAARLLGSSTTKPSASVRTSPSLPQRLMMRMQVSIVVPVRDEAARIDASMIVVGNRRVQGKARVLGSIATDVTRTAPCDVLVVDTTTKAAAAPSGGLRISSATVFERCTPKQRQAIDELATPIAVRAGQELAREG